jgi:hypothetical protein
MSGLIWNSELKGSSPHLCQLGTDRLAPMSEFELCTGAYMILWGPTNWVASCAAETEPILPYLMGVKWDSAWATHGVSTEAYTWKTCTRVRWALIVSLTALWIVATHGALLARVSCCQVHTLARFRLAWVSVIPSDMGNTYPLQSFSSNSTFLMIYLVHEMDIDYKVVNKMINIKIV